MTSESPGQPLEVLILTVIGPELRAVQKSLKLSNLADRIIVDGELYWRGSVESEVTGSALSLLVHCIGIAGNSLAASTTSKLIERFRPRFVVLVGIAAGREGKVKIGDAVVPKSVLDYTQNVATKDGYFVRPTITALPYPVQQAYTAFKASFEPAEWHQHFERVHGPPILAPNEDQAQNFEAHVAKQPALHESVIASADLLLRNEDVLEGLARSVHEQVRIGEMEAAGFVSACCGRSPGIPWLVIRGVSDFGNAFKDDRFHYFAACSAASFLAYYLMTGHDPCLIPDAAHWPTTSNVSQELKPLASGELGRIIEPPRSLESDSVSKSVKSASGGSSESPPVVTVDVEGNSTVSSQTILAVVSTQPGASLSEPQLRRDLQAIFDLGLFTDVRFATPSVENGIRLVFRVLENPTIKDIEFIGNEVVSSNALAGLTVSKVGEVLNTRIIYEDIHRINAYYNDVIGCLRTPTHVTDLGFDDGSVIFTIVDGIVLTEVNILGVSVYPLTDISQIFNLKIGSLFNRKTVERKIQKVSDRYEADGWVLDNIDPTIDPETGQLWIHVYESTVEEIEFDGEVNFAAASVLSKFQTKVGQALNRPRFQSDLAYLLEHHCGHVEPSFSRGSSRGLISLRVFCAD